MITDFNLQILIEPLLNWFAGHARVLPWREEPTPYRVWVSEIMLQQTRVEAVKPYFERFTKRLPDVEALAECPEDELLKLWEGLGYYNRVRNMQKAAIQVMEEHGGKLPADYEELLKLKGIGSYTAGAIASIAYQIPVPAVDGNVFRVLTRVAADDTDIMKPSFRTLLEKELREVMHEMETPGAFNQALMELGATVCVPNGAPLCEQCPWNSLCLARKEGRIAELPVKTKAKARRIEKRTVLVIRDNDKVAIRKRPEKGLLAGLYELPNVEGRYSQDEIVHLVKDMHLSPIRVQKLENAKHIFSHIEWQMEGYAILVEEAGFDAEAEKMAEKYPNVDGICRELQKKYTYAEEEYMVVAPENIFAIIKEGRMLHHCVGNDGSGERYYERMERRESFILFLRRTDEPEDPYYTLEIEPDGTVRQKRTLFDRQHEDIEQATDFLRRWQKVIAERLTGRDLKLAAESRILREKEFIQLKKDRVIIHTGHLAGRLLADVLMADLMENTDSIQSPALAAAA